MIIKESQVVKEKTIMFLFLIRSWQITHNFTVSILL